MPPKKRHYHTEEGTDRVERPVTPARGPPEGGVLQAPGECRRRSVSAPALPIHTRGRFNEIGLVTNVLSLYGRSEGEGFGFRQGFLVAGKVARSGD